MHILGSKLVIFAAGFITAKVLKDGAASEVLASAREKVLGLTKTKKDKTVATKKKTSTRRTK